MLRWPKRTLLLFILTLPLAPSVSAQMTERRDPVFRIETDLLEKGEVHFSYHQVTAAQIQKHIPEFVELDGAKLLEREGATLEVTKLAYVVNKPVGFFSSTQMTDAKWLTTLLGKKVQLVKEDNFKVESLGKMRVYFDSDDLSSVQNSRFVHSVTQSKKLDPIALSGFSTVVLHSQDKVEIHNHVPFSPLKTLVISYHISVVKKGDSKKQRLAFIKETEARLVRAYP
jgi:hypothetical protein